MMELWKHSRSPFRHGSEGVGGMSGKMLATGRMAYRLSRPGRPNSSSSINSTGFASRKPTYMVQMANNVISPKQFTSRLVGHMCLLRARRIITTAVTRQCVVSLTTVKVLPHSPACRFCSTGMSFSAHGRTDQERPAIAMCLRYSWMDRHHLQCATRTGRICPGTTVPIAATRCWPSTAIFPGSILTPRMRSGVILIRSRFIQLSDICVIHSTCTPARRFGRHGCTTANDAAYFDRISIMWASCVAESCN